MTILTWLAVVVAFFILFLGMCAIVCLLKEVWEIIFK